MSTALVHLMRHGQVHNPDGVLYERLPDFHLSDIGRAMAERMGEHTAEFDLAHLRCSPLERARETMEPIARRRPDLEVTLDDRVIEAGNKLAGRVFTGKVSQLMQPAVLRHLYNPLKPSWGEPYPKIVTRMQAAIRDAAEAANGREALIVSHQLPIWITRLAAEGRPLVHDPRRRECTLASITTLEVTDGRITRVSYAEPALDLVPVKDTEKSKKFVAGA
ncbi:histidine phosphatase family protein [Mariniluteicoccus flavus]